MAKRMPGTDVVREVLKVERWELFPRSVVIHVRLQDREQRMVLISERNARALVAGLEAAGIG